MKHRTLIHLALAGLLSVALAATVAAQKLPSDPVGGQPAVGSKPSTKDLSDRVTYQRAFEAVVWSMPAMIKYGMRRGSIEIGAGDNVIMAWSGGATALLETLTPNNVTPYVTSTTDLRNGPVVLDVPKATDKANCSPSEELRALLSPSSSDGLHYGPLEGYIDKSWVLNDLELVK